MNSRNNQMLEAFRFISCIAIMFIHVHFPAPYGTYLAVASRFAVPFFLIISGYYSNLETFEKPIKKLLDALRIIFISAPICFIWNCINSYLKSSSFILWFERFFKKDTIIEFLLFNRATFLNSVFYYLFMLVYIYMLCILLSKIHFKASGISLVLIFLIIICSWYIDHFTEYPWYYVGNVFFTGIPMFFIGQYLRSHPAFIKKTKGKELALIITGYILTIIEYNINQENGYCYLGQILVAVMLFCFCQNYSERRVHRAIVYLGSFCSIYIMIMHCEIRDMLSIYMAKDNFVFPVIVCVATIIISVVLSKLVQFFRGRRPQAPPGTLIQHPQ